MMEELHNLVFYIIWGVCPLKTIVQLLTMEFCFFPLFFFPFFPQQMKES